MSTSHNFLFVVWKFHSIQDTGDLSISSKNAAAKAHEVGVDSSISLAPVVDPGLQAISRIFGHEALTKIRQIHRSYLLVLTCPYCIDAGGSQDQLYLAFKDK